MIICGGRVNIQMTFSVSDYSGCEYTVLANYNHSGFAESGILIELSNIRSGGHITITWTPSSGDTLMYGVSALIY